jgi:TPR repeat protein
VKAVDYFKLSANQGNEYAQLNYASCRESGCGVAQDVKIAALWYKRSRDQGNA